MKSFLVRLVCAVEMEVLEVFASGRYGEWLRFWVGDDGADVREVVEKVWWVGEGDVVVMAGLHVQRESGAPEVRKDPLAYTKQSGAWE